MNSKLQMAKTSKPKDVSQPEKFRKITYYGLFQFFLLRAPLLWATFDEVSEEVQTFLAGKDDEEKPDNQVKIEECKTWVEEQLAAYRVD